jgi:hypothetical protein
MTSRHTNLQAPHPLRKPKLASPCGSQSVGLGHEHTTIVADAQLFKKGGFKKFKSKMALIDSF